MTLGIATGGETAPRTAADVPEARRVHEWAARDWRLSAAGTGAIGLVVAAFLMVRSRHEWFFIDEWEVLANRVGPHPAVGIMIPHNEHPVMIPIAIWRVLFDVFGMGRYYPYMAVLVACQLAVVTLVWLVARRSGAGPLACLAAAAVMATAGVGSEDMIWAFQIGMVGSLIGTWLGTVLTDRPRGANGPARLALTWAVLTAGLACSAVSVPLLVVPLIVAGARRGWRAGLLVVCVPGVLFLAWYLRWGRDGVTAPTVLPLQLAGYVIQGLTSAVDGITGITGTAAVSAVLVVVAIRAGVLGTAERAVATAGLAGVLALYAFISIGRVGLGDAQAQSSRYAYLAAALVLPAAAAGLQALVDSERLGHGRTPAGRRSRHLTWLAIGVCTVGVCGRGTGLLDNAIGARVIIGAQTRAIAAAGNVLAAGRTPLLAGRGASKYSGHLDGAALIRLHRLGKLPSKPTPTGASVAQLRLTMQFDWLPAMSRSAFGQTRTATEVAPLPTYLPGDPHPNPVVVALRPRPFTGTPELVAGHLVATPPSVPAVLDCLSAAPSGASVVIQLRPGPGAQAVLLLVAGATMLRYGWAASGASAASILVPMNSQTVYELATTVGSGVIRLTAGSPLTVCPVA